MRWWVVALLLLNYLYLELGDSEFTDNNFKRMRLNVNMPQTNGKIVFWMK